MTPADRRAAALKAAATRRANRAAANGGYVPPPQPRRRRQRPFRHAAPPFKASAKPFGQIKKARVLMFEALAKFEAALAAKLDERGAISPEEEKAFDRYKDFVKRAIAPIGGANPALREADQNEADNGLRLAAIALVKLVI